MIKKTIIKGQENIKDGLRDKLDLCFKHKRKPLDTGRHGGNFWNMTPELDLQAALVTRNIESIFPSATTNDYRLQHCQLHKRHLSTYP